MSDQVLFVVVSNLQIVFLRSVIGLYHIWTSGEKSWKKRADGP